MAKNYDFEIYGQPSHHDPKERKLKVYFSEPDKGVSKKTGILLFIAGFGGHANSNVYKKMRSNFADKYNLITVQCDYFGWEFMQGFTNISLNISKAELEKYFIPEEINYIYKDADISNRFIEVASKYNIQLTGKEVLKESLDNYNDMGLIQAIDNISAVTGVIEIIKDNGLEFNQDKVIVYGVSQGAYLSYLCNAFAPNLFSLLIDNSSWLFPAYLKANRMLYGMYGKAQLAIEFDYLAKRLDYDEEILNLLALYKKFDNKCDIICYHGISDDLISHNDKFKLKEVIKGNFIYNIIDESKIDNKIFKSTEHGLNADFIELFDYTFKNYSFKENRKYGIELENVCYRTRRCRYVVEYTSSFPSLHIADY